jgi:hypothetical protein
LGEQQARIVAHGVADKLAPVPDLHLETVERAGGEHLLAVLARMDQRRIPQRGERGIAPPRAIDGLVAHPHAHRGRARVALEGEVIEEADAKLAGEDRAAADLRRLTNPTAGDTFLPAFAMTRSERNATCSS